MLVGAVAVQDLGRPARLLLAAPPPAQAQPGRAHRIRQPCLIFLLKLRANQVIVNKGQ